MCLAVVARAGHPKYASVVAANRDEFHQRPSAAAAPWQDASWVLGGRDLQAGGSWLAVAVRGGTVRWALLTNVREPAVGAGPRSRGELVQRCLLDPQPLGVVLAHLAAERDAFAGFNLLAAEGASMWMLGNRAEVPLRPLPAALYGLSNGALDEPWPKVIRAREALAQWLAHPDASPPQLLTALSDVSQPPDADLPDSGVGRARERLLAPVFIAHPVYGTRASTVVTVAHDGGVTLIERSFGPDGRHAADVTWCHAADGSGWRRVTTAA